MVEDSYCEDNGRPSLDPVILIKLPVLQYMFGIRSMRQTIQEIKVNKETIERIFGLAKELHGFRYTQQFGKAQMEVKAALTYACLNLKKLAKKRWKNRPIPSFFRLILDFFSDFFNIYKANPLSASA